MARQSKKLHNEFVEGNDGATNEVGTVVDTNEDNENSTNEEVSSTKRTEDLIVTFEGDIEKNFGKRAQTLTETEVDVENKAIKVNVYYMDGSTLNYERSLDDIGEFELKVFAEGLVSKAKASTSSCGGDLDKIKEVYKKKFLQEYPCKIFVERATGDNNTAFTQLELVWAYSQKIDVYTPEGIKAVQEFFAPMDTEGRKQLKSTKEWKLAYHNLEMEKLLNS